ncbi:MULTISPECIES: hypothetical protein [unclassified Rathayibacter]|uniref:hypothetical protein n=1 Tax=unclassified Rathayibacter TaxID=2609250 RepID=UPI000CE920E3|nr:MULTISPECIES: hypothetical protein [unclassified Rathayibacter]PPF14673.1 hypothetical protein C5B92_14640 [Rathayibacter sp. AY1A4]PPF52927.1 hypothetical protein C5C55_14795 [Rathayibacter sp. AY1C2]PPG57142.1 hypothetical protein C5C69_14960 [Rathayibacter sp. AY1C7]PPH77076.1 hypothetical protein C5C50_15630 [Rathayibacter sp. AY1D9]PPH88257.1 hypothetical protein C5C82_08930 [Rathayibacter sp. AY1D5]
MIQQVCLALLIALVLVRAPRAAAKPAARPAFWATVSGAVALSTYGFPIPFFTYDALLGGTNVITLVRDLAAASAFWFFREALGRRAGGEGRVGSRWGLAIMFGSYIVPFLLIGNRGRTSVDFIIDRLDQTAVWLYGSAYMATLVWLSVSSIINARRNWRGVQLVFITGFAITTIGCLIEIAFLTASHFGYGGDAFRYSAWNAAEIPFFLGLLIIMLGIGWTAIVVPLRRRIDVARASKAAVRHGLIERPPFTTYLSDRRLIAHAQQILVLTKNAEVRGEGAFTFDENAAVARVRTLIAPDQAFTPRVIGGGFRKAA